MAKALKTVGMIAGGVALLATGIGAFAAAGSALAATAGSVASIATVVTAAANTGAQLLAKPPPARGSVTQILIAADAPVPYVMGEGLVGGVLRHDVAYGPRLKKVPNPYRFMAVVYSGGGPVESISPRVEFAPVSSWYNGFLYTGTSLGTIGGPALSPYWAGAPGWGSTYRLSGYAAIGWSLKFDRDGERFASGVPLTGAYGKWVKVYDPRRDSTFPGGSGPHRLGEESTYEWSENPALHAGTYAFGRWQNGKRALGIGLPAEGINWSHVAAWANVCDANGWTLFGVVYEPGDRWANLRDICLAGGAEPIPGAVLGFRWSAPAVELLTIGPADLADGPQQVTAQHSYRDRINTAVPKYRSPEHNWELIDLAPVVNAPFLAEDGEEKRDTWPWNLVKKPVQAAQLTAYRLWDSRELPLVLTVKPHLRHLRAGDCVRVRLPEADLDRPAIVLRRQVDPQSFAVTLELRTETPGKHAFCLGRTAVPPPTPALGQSVEERDALAAAVVAPTRAALQVVTRTVAFPVTSTATTISVAAFSAVLDDGRSVAFPAATIGGLAEATTYAVLFDLATGTYTAEALPATAGLADSGKAVIDTWATASSGGTYTPPDEPPPGYGGGGGIRPRNQVAV